MGSSYKTVNSINTYPAVPQNLTLSSTRTKVQEKQRNTRVRTQLTTIKRAQSDTTASARFIPTALHSFYKAITRAHTEKISLYNNIDTACYADSGASEYMFPDYSTFKTYHRLFNRYATL